MLLKTTAAQTRGAYVAAELMKPPGEGPPPHVHDDAEEAFLVLEGEFEYNIGGKRVKAAAGTFVFVPRGVEHSFRNCGNSDARYLGIMSPAPQAPIVDHSAESDRRREAFGQ